MMNTRTTKRHTINSIQDKLLSDDSLSDDVLSDNVLSDESQKYNISINRYSGDIVKPCYHVSVYITHFILVLYTAFTIILHKYISIF